MLAPRYYFIYILVPGSVPIPIPIPPARPSESTTRGRESYVRLLSYSQRTRLVIRFIYIFIPLGTTLLLYAVLACTRLVLILAH